MPDEKNKTADEEQKEMTKSIAEKTWEDDDDWMEDPSGINPGC